MLGHLADQRGIRGAPTAHRIGGLLRGLTLRGCLGDRIRFPCSVRSKS